jgi:hypothetical protein
MQELLEGTADARIHLVRSRGSRANYAGSFSERPKYIRSGCQMPASDELEISRGICMPTSRSTFTKRQKEHTRQQKQRDKAERKNQRKLEKAVGVRVDETAEPGEDAPAGDAAVQPALSNLGAEGAITADESTRADRIDD